MELMVVSASKFRTKIFEIFTQKLFRAARSSELAERSRGVRVCSKRNLIELRNPRLAGSKIFRRFVEASVGSPARPGSSCRGWFSKSLSGYNPSPGRPSCSRCDSRTSRRSSRGNYRTLGASNLPERLRRRRRRRRR